MIVDFRQFLINPYLTITILFLVTWFFWREKRYRWIYILYKTWRRDIKGIRMILRAFYRIMKFEREQDTIPKLFTRVVRSRPNKIAFYYEDETWTFQELEDFSNKIANYFIAAGYKKGDTVALLLENRPEYVAIWLGLAKVGIVTALINTNLISKPLRHCISVAEVKALIFGSDFVNAVDGISSNLENVKLLQLNTCTSEKQQKLIENALDLKQCLADQSIASPEKHLEESVSKDKVLYIYTSGTTGLPKAAKITHSRFYFAVTGLNSFLELDDDDIFYNSLPLYHGSGLMLAIGQCINYGVTVALRKKFSASNFWTDCAKYKCTVTNYIGETCRYILAANKGRSDIKHGIKKMIGNGLKKDIWREFVDTFNIPCLYEFYGSTEGNSNLINLDGTLGAIGFYPFYMAPLRLMALIKCDDETKEPLRDKDGLCIQCKTNEPGILIGKINKKISTQQFDGYAESQETKKKILVNVFRKGDSFFNSGDLMVMDELGYIYFKDRTGDTYRWKGENVATTEVEFVISEILGPKAVVVYGVEVPRTDGRAGMIAIEDKTKSLNTKTLAEGLKSHLPSYAIPLFLRVMDSLPVTGTFKVKKAELQNEGFDIKKIKDPVYIYDSKKVDYIPIEDLFETIVTGKTKL